MSFFLSKRSLSKLRGVDSRLVRVVRHAIQITEVDFAVTEGMRGKARQRWLVVQGRSRTLRSKHLVGHAVDLMAAGDLDGDGDIDAQDKSITWDREHYGKLAEAMYEAARALDVTIRWGGSFKSFYDGPHFELV